MNWPNHADYSEAIQNPELCFDLPELSVGTVATDALGLPRALSGNFATVYEVRSPSDSYAVRCFIRQVTNQRTRYAALEKFLQPLQLPFMVPFQFVDRGICVNNEWYPIVRMDWVSGDPLHQFIEKNLKQSARIELLSIDWRELVRELAENEIGHGDLQHGNVLVTAAGKLKLVDYDGMFIPLFARERSPEMGHPNYQHPLRTPDFYDEQLDHFTAALIYLCLKAVAADPALWKEFHNGDNLLVTAADMRAPQCSTLWPRLLESPDKEVRRLTVFLTDFLKLDPANVPDLETILESSLRGVIVPDRLVFDEPPAPVTTAEPPVEPAGVPNLPGTVQSHPESRPVKLFEVAGWSAFLLTLLALLPPIRIIGGVSALLAGLAGLVLPGTRVHLARGLAVLAVAGSLAMITMELDLPVSARQSEALPIATKRTGDAAIRPLAAVTPFLARTEVEDKPVETGGDIVTVLPEIPQSVSRPLSDPVAPPVVHAIHRWQAASGSIKLLAFSGDGRHLVAVTEGGLMTIWNCERQSRVHSIQLKEPLVSLTGLTNAGIFATTDRANLVKWWSVDGGIPLKQMQLNEDSLFPPALSLNGRDIAVGSGERRSVDLHTNLSATATQRMSGFGSWVKQVAFSPDQSLVVATCYDDTISVLDAANGRVTRLFHFPDADVVRSRISSNNLWLVAWGSVGGLRVWNLESEKLTLNQPAFESMIVDAAFSDNQNWLLVADETGRIACFLVENGLQRIPTLADRAEISSMALSPTGHELATATAAGEIRIWRTSELIGEQPLQMARP